MENEKNLALDGAENVEQTTEETQPIKTYTQEEVDAIVGKKIARTKAKIAKENERKYGELEEVLRVGMGKEDIGEITKDLRSFYTERKGIKIPEKPKYTDKDIETLAMAEANEIIKGGYDDVVDEVERLTEIGAANMTAREKAVFKVLANHRQNAERGNALAKIGVPEDVYTSKEYKDFEGMFNENTPPEKVYELYRQAHPKKEITSMGSMKTTEKEDNGVKEYYSYEEAKKFSVDDFNKNPALYEAVKKSMLKWK